MKLCKKIFIMLTCASISLTAQAAPQTINNPFAAPSTLKTLPVPLNIPAANTIPAISEQVSTYQLSYVSAKDICESLRPLYNNKLSLDPVTNSIILQGNNEQHSHLQKLLQELDIAGGQVTLEAKIISLSCEDSKNIGINWNWDTIPQREYVADNNTTKTSNEYDGNFKFWHGYAFRFNATLNAMISSGKAKILATPRIITIPGREASIFIGDHIPVQTEKHDSSGTYTATEYLDAGIKLRYTPIISKDGKMVTANVHTEVSTPVLISELKNYRITSRTADTNVRMYSGETLVIGGLISTEEQKTLQKVPFFSSLPLLGELFTNRSKKSSTTEVILLLTPHITDAGASPAIYSKANDMH